MNRIIKNSLKSLLLVPALVLGVSAAMPVLQPMSAYAQQSCDPATGGIAGGASCASNQDSSTAKNLPNLIQTITNYLLFFVGAVAVIMLIYGGFKYVISGGDASSVTAAKNTILYAIIGIIVAILAYAIVNFVITNFLK